MDRQQEEKQLKYCVGIIQRNVEKYQAESDQMTEEIKEMYDNYRSDSPELHNDLVISIARKAQLDEMLSKNRKALDKPYFGRIDYLDKEEDKRYRLYIGKNGVVKDGTILVVIDWRAPVSSIYYDCQNGDAVYQVPEQEERPIFLDLKRTYEIKESQLIDFYDSEVVTNDELLTKYLAKNKEAVLGEIIATIQKEQNEIIRQNPFRNTIVQGVAGSGKTTVAMHRISYILYNYPEKFRANEFFIIGSNQMLLRYITGVLPDLDVHNVNQTIMDDFFIQLLDKDLKKKEFQGKKNTSHMEQALYNFHQYKSSLLWFECLKEYADQYVRDNIPTDSVYCGEKEIYPEESILEFLRNNESYSLHEKIDMLNKRLTIKLKDYWTGLHVEPELIKAKLKPVRTHFGIKAWKRNLKEIYEAFVRNMYVHHIEYQVGLSELLKALDHHYLDVYDLAALTYLKWRLKTTQDMEEVRHIVVDEAQDFGVMIYAVLKQVLPKASFTIMGDVSQNIHYESGMNDWEALKLEVFDKSKDKFHVLAKSYRNTIEISNFAQSILDKCSFTTYEIEPIIRHGREVRLIQEEDLTKLVKESAKEIKKWQENGYETIAVICKDEEETKMVKRQLGEEISLKQGELSDAVFTQGVMVLPIFMTKGLEFDTVLIWNPTNESYPKNDGNAKLLYVAVTRALHECSVFYMGELSKLLNRHI